VRDIRWVAELHVARCEDSVHCCILLYIGESIDIGFHDLPASSRDPQSTCNRMFHNLRV
jgi:hypothetical protein